MAWQLIAQEAGAVVCSNGRFKMRLAAYAPHIVRVTYTSRDSFALIDEPMIVACPEGKLAWEDYHISAGVLSADVNAETGILSWQINGEVLMQEAGHTLREIDVIKYRYDPDSPVTEVQTVDGVRARAQGTQYVERKAYQTRLSFTFSTEEAIYGLGQHEEGVLNYRGQHQFLYQNNLKIACPVVVSSKGWAVLNNNCSAQIFHDDAFGSYISADCAEEMDYFVIAGPELDDIVASIRHLTGDTPLLPRWSLGYVQSKEHYHTAKELTETANEYRRRQVPIDCIVQDWQTWPNKQWGQKTVDKNRYPDLKGTIDQLHDQHIRLMLSIWPNMNGNCPNQLEFIQKGQMLGNRRTYNAFDPNARETYWNQCNEQLFPSGLDAWWCDCTEPFEYDWNGEEKMFPEDRMNANVGEFKRYIDPAQILAYSIHHSKTLYDGQRSVTDQKRVVNLTRSGLTGQQRYGTICWNGDTSANWKTLQRTVPDGLNIAVCGIPYWTVDAGGFFTKGEGEWFRDGHYPEGCKDDGFRELYTRWIQLSAFLPMMRSHGTDTPREIWQFGEKGETYYDAIEKAIQLRYLLMPYLYSEMAAVHFERKTMMRMLAFDFRKDAEACNISDQYMFGNALMVCPVLTARVNETAVRRVYLPKGCDWYDFWTNERISGGQWLTVHAKIDEIPLYVRAGSILPLGSEIQYADQEQQITLRIYPGADAVYTLYSDDGDGYAYERGEYLRTVYSWTDAKQNLSACYEGDKRYIPSNILTEIVK